MPTKFKPIEETYDRRTKKTTVTYHWIKGTPLQDLLAAIDNPNTKPKLIHKFKKEILRRKKYGNGKN